MSTYKNSPFSDWKEPALSLLVAIFCFLLFYLFPSNDFLQSITKSIFFFFLIPFFYVKLILKKNFWDFGFNLRNKKEGFFWSGILLLFLIVLFFFIIRYTEFDKTYNLPFFIKTSFGYFLLYELVLVNLLFLLQEIFFKGFLLSVLREKLNYWSILIQSTIFLFPLFIYSSYFIQVLPMIILSLLGGFVAYKTRTFVFSYLTGIIFLILLDAYIIFINK